MNQVQSQLHNPRNYPHRSHPLYLVLNQLLSHQDVQLASLLGNHRDNPRDNPRDNLQFSLLDNPLVIRLGNLLQNLRVNRTVNLDFLQPLNLVEILQCSLHDSRLDSQHLSLQDSLFVDLPLNPAGHHLHSRRDNQQDSHQGNL